MKIHRTAAVAASSLVVLLSLAACGERTEGQTVGGGLDSAVARTGEVAGAIRQEAREANVGVDSTATEAAGEAASTISETTQEARQDARTSVMGAAADTRQAVAGPGQAVGAKVDDAQITSRVSASLMGDKELSAVRIDVGTRDGVVTLSGPVPSSTVKARANEIARGVKDVKSVDNQLTVSAS